MSFGLRRADGRRPLVTRRLFWGIYGHGLLMLALVALTVGALGWALRGHPPSHHKPHRLARLITESLHDRDDATIGDRLAELGDLLNLDLALFDRRGRRVAESAERPVNPLSREEYRHLMSLPPGLPLMVDGPRVQAVRVGRSGSCVVTRWRGPGGGRFLAAIAVVLVVLALVSWPRARSIARPVERTIQIASQWSRGDLSPRIGMKRGPADMVAMAEALDAMAERLQAHRARERALLADVSHELRTPLARLRVALEWAEEDKVLPAPLEGVGADLAELERLVDDVLMASRLETGESLVVRPEPTTVAAVVTAAAARFAERHPDLPVQVSATALPLAADPALLRRALENLFENAARYGAPPIVVTAQRSVAPGRPDLAEVVVSDAGEGVPADALPHLFDPFYRVDASRTRSTGGVGLGLALVRKIIEAHGGVVSAAPASTGGLAVTIRLPLAPEA